MKSLIEIKKFAEENHLDTTIINAQIKQILIEVEDHLPQQGKLIFKGNELGTIEAYGNSLEALIEQLNNINDVNFIKATFSGKDYIDRILQIYKNPFIAKSNTNDNATNVETELAKLAQLNKIQSIIKELFNNEIYWDKLQELGATDIDKAFITNDLENVNKLIDNLSYNDPYHLAKYLRCFDIAKEIYQDEFSCDVTVMSNSKNTTLSNILNQTFYFHNKDNDIKTLAVIVKDEGKRVYDYNNGILEFEALKENFDAMMMFGSGSNSIYLDNIPIIMSEITGTVFFLPNLKQKTIYQNLDLAFFQFEFHGSSHDNQLGEVFKKIPHNIAPTTIFMIKSCYSGQYHQNWQDLAKEEILITTSSDNESSDIMDFSSTKLYELLTLKPLNLVNFIEYFATFKNSTPYLSGKILPDMIVYNQSAKDLYDQLSDNSNHNIDQLESPRIDTEITASELAGIDDIPNYCNIL